MKVVFITILSLTILLTSFARSADDELATVRGQVTTLWGEPCEEVTVSFYQLEGIWGISPTEKLIKQAKTGKNGEYSVTDLPWGQYRVDVSFQGYGHTEVWRFYLWRNAKRVLDLGVPMGMLDHVSQMKVSGKITYDNGNAVENATITLANAHNLSKMQQARTDSSGNYSFEEIQIGDYVVWATKPGYALATTSVRLGNGEQKVVNLKLLPQVQIKKL